MAISQDKNLLVRIACDFSFVWSEPCTHWWPDAWTDLLVEMFAGLTGRSEEKSMRTRSLATAVGLSLLSLGVGPD